MAKETIATRTGMKPHMNIITDYKKDQYNGQGGEGGGFVLSNKQPSLILLIPLL
jgi:hypothetical protein